MDNDLMARRLRPPSEPPRPQNGHHAPMPTETPPWAMTTEPQPEVPWDRPEVEPWPPVAGDEELLTHPQQMSDVWPPVSPVAPTAAPEMQATVEPEVETAPGFDAANEFGLPDFQPERQVQEAAPRAWDDQPASAQESSQQPPWQSDWQPAPAVEQAPWVAADAPVAATTVAETTWADVSPWPPQPDNGNGISAEAHPSVVETPAVAEPTPAWSAPSWPTPPRAPLAPAPPAADVVETPSDVSVAGRAPWDRPAEYPWDAPADFDDRPADMLAAYDDMIPDDDIVPVVTRFVAAATAPEHEPEREIERPGVAEPPAASAAPEPPAAPEPQPDPYDADAPLLNDVPQPMASSWPAWETPAQAEPARAPVQPEFNGRPMSPTPPDDLFGRPATMSQPAARKPAQMSTPQAPAPEPQLPAVYSTTPQVPQQPLVLRIELAFVDDSPRVRPVDAARRVGPAFDEEPDAEAPTPRHPEFEPRSHVAPATDDQVEVEAIRPSQTFEPEPQAMAAPEPIEAPEVMPALSPVDEPAWRPAATDWPAATAAQWSLPALEPAQPELQPEPVAPPQELSAPAPWAWPQREHVVEAPYAQAPVPHPEPLEPAWAGPNPTATWTLQPTPPDPLSTLPAATFATPVAPAYAAPAAAPAAPVAQPAPVVTSAAAAPAQTAAPISSAPARPAANADQSDLWFLASEPDIATADEPAAAEKTGPSTILTAGLTVVMAVVVIALVLIFIQLMTSLLR